MTTIPATQDESSARYACFYCGSSDLQLHYPGRFHRRKKDHGPFDLYRCRGCGSALTLPPPSPQVLDQLYSSFEFGLSQFSRQLLAENPEAIWHELCAGRLAALSGKRPEDSFTWIDVGAGGGEVAHSLAQRFPASRGIAIDLHERPPKLEECKSVEWRTLDLSQDSFASGVAAHGDLVFATGVWEHVRRPDVFARNMLSLLNPGGALYMTTPNYGSLARRLFGAKWPYLIPGEHLCMPTPKGARLCLRRELSAVRGAESKARIGAKPVLITYNLRFVAAKFDLARLAAFIPESLNALLPSGAMESTVQLASAG